MFKRTRNQLAGVISRWTRLAPIAIAVSLAVGCKSEPSEWVPGDADNIKHVIAEISDARHDPEKLAVIFAAGKVPNDKWIKDSQGLSFVVDLKRISVSGDAATVKISLEDHFGDPKGEVTWTCKKNGEKWQVEDAPLK